MDHIGILKRALSIMWRSKILWLFGLFVVAPNAVSSGLANFPTEGFVDPGMVNGVRGAHAWLQENVQLVVAIGGLVALVGLALFIVSVAAKGGLIRLANEAADERAVSGVDGWLTGFNMWFRVFGISFVLFAPLVLFAGALGLALLVPVVSPLVVNGDPPRPEILVGLCGGLGLGLLVILVAGVFLDVLDTLAARHSVLFGSGVFRSIGAALGDVRVRFKDVALVWLLMLAVGIGYAVTVGTASAVLSVGMMMAMEGDLWVLAGAIAVMTFVVLLVPATLFATFHSVTWTLLFRRITGLEPPAIPGGAPSAVPAPPYPVPTPVIADEPEASPSAPTAPRGIPLAQPQPPSVPPPSTSAAPPPE